MTKDRKLKTSTHWLTSCLT